MSRRKLIMAVLCAVSIACSVGMGSCLEPLRASPGLLNYNIEERVMETTFTNRDRVNDITVDSYRKEGTTVERFEVLDTGCVREQNRVAKNGGTCILRIRLVRTGGGRIVISLLNARRRVVGAVVAEPS